MIIPGVAHLPNMEKEVNIPINRIEWRPALLHALPVTVVVLSLLYYWFAIADRYVVFLYEHNMGPFVPDTSPFSDVTSSRYWMAGLVAGGMVMILYTGVSWLLGRVVRGYRPPAWWWVWAMSSVPLLVGVPLITMTVNVPTLPVLNAAQTTLATVMSMGLALMPGKMAAEDPWELIWLSLDGWAMAAVMLSVAMLERVGWLLGRGIVWPLLVIVVGLVGAVVVLLVMTGVRIWRRMIIPRASALFVAGLCLAYLLMPLVHHLGFTDGYYYVSDKDNFFSRSWALQGVAWLVAGAIAVGVTRLRGYLAIRRAGARGLSACHRSEARQ